MKHYIQTCSVYRITEKNCDKKVMEEIVMVELISFHLKLYTRQND